MNVESEVVSVDMVVRDILIRVDDEHLRKGLTKGYYVSLVNKALERLAITTFYNQEPVLDVPMPANFRWQLPDNFFNIQELYAWNGDCCDVKTSANIYWKRNFNNAPNGKGYTALNKGYQQSADTFFYGPFPGGEGVMSFPQNTVNGVNGDNLLYANVQNGWLMFSSACQGYSNFRIIYNGYGGVIGNKPAVPRPLRKVVTDLCVLSAFRTLMVRFPKSGYGGSINDCKDELYNKSTGSWWEAQIFVRQADTWINNMRELYGCAPINGQV